MKAMRLLVGILYGEKDISDRMEEGIKEKVIEYWDNHSCAIPDQKHVLRQCSSRGIYKEHCKHVMEMIGVALFKEFKESNPSVCYHLSCT